MSQGAPFCDTTAGGSIKEWDNEAMMAANAQILITRQARANMVEGKMPGLPQITFTDETQVFLGGKEVAAK